MEYVSYENLKAKYINNCGIVSKVPYNELLGTFEWQKKRNEIIERDKEQCQKCGIFKPILDKVYLEFWEQMEPPFNEMPVPIIYQYDGNREYVMNINGTRIPCYLPSLHVHHKKYYIENKMLRLPWEYNSDDLIAYCIDCHAKWHLENKIEIEFVDCNSKISFEREVIPCNKCQGEGWLPQYSHIEGGICFRCGGIGIEIESISWNNE
ncbi:5-methylcytosine-specific restriction endonuclease McrA [Dysgonomonas hofstadii]|uniref:5-methylcytosine-specific restriction endonuclease McrA n=1 Tax=Dysgonomonas hofstadii TaxID=637886 RepID=A0A840CSP1_9BACT|nr:hypothetical protein [Dysgonomonas hofstadii]MBB4035915.1 5-methylcytosine-specific restriction endonuclease McrA [Dysgonomonas hofstadii]